MDKELKRGCIVFMKASSGLVGYGNGQCVSEVHHESLGTISLYGHNRHYKTYDIDKIVEYPECEALRTQLAALRDLRCPPISDGDGLCICPIEELEEKNGKLKEFARHVIKQECWACYSLDGGEIQDLAEKLGLIKPHTATEDDVDEESDFEVGDTIYKFSETLAEQAKENEDGK